jgi:hypothetical protein
MSRVLPPANNQVSTDAKNNPVVMSGETMTSDKELYQGEDRILKSSGDAMSALDQIGFARVTDQPYDEEKMAMLAFMNEDVEIRIATSTDPNAEQVFELTINGRTELFRRGEKKVVKRHFVDLMMRQKETRYKWEHIVDSEGEKHIRYIPYTALKYDFSITRDLHPMSADWQNAVMKEAG